MSHLKEYLLDIAQIKEPLSVRETEEFNSQFYQENAKMEQLFKDQSELGPGVSVFDNLFKPMNMPQYRKALFFAVDIKKKIPGGLISLKENPSSFVGSFEETKEMLLTCLFLNDKSVLDFNEKEMVVRYGSDFAGCSPYVDYIVCRGVELDHAEDTLEFRSKWAF